MSVHSERQNKISQQNRKEVDMDEKSELQLIIKQKLMIQGERKKAAKLVNEKNQGREYGPSNLIQYFVVFLPNGRGRKCGISTLFYLIEQDLMCYSK